MVPRGPFWAVTKGSFGPFWAFFWSLLLLLTIVNCCEIKDLEFNSLTSTSVVLTWEVFVSQKCPLKQTLLPSFYLQNEL